MILLKAVSRRSIIWLNVSASRCSSSPVLRRASRIDKRCSLIDRAVLVIASTGASALRLIQYPPRLARTSTMGMDKTSKIGRASCREREEIGGVEEARKE